MGSTILKNLTSEQKLAMISADNYKILRQVCSSNKNSAILNLLLKELNPEQKQIALSYDNFSLFSHIIDRGSSVIFKRLAEELSPEQMRVVVALGNFKAYCLSVDRRDLSMMDKIFEMASVEQRQQMIALDGYNKFNLAIADRLFAVVNKFLEQVGADQKSHMISGIDDLVVITPQILTFIHFPHFEDFTPEESKEFFALQVMKEVYLVVFDDIISFQERGILFASRLKIAESVARRVGNYILENIDKIQEVRELRETIWGSADVLETYAGCKLSAEEKKKGIVKPYVAFEGEETKIRNLNADELKLIFDHILPAFKQINFALYPKKDKECIDVANSAAIRILNNRRLTTYGIVKEGGPSIQEEVAAMVKKASSTEMDDESYSDEKMSDVDFSDGDFSDKEVMFGGNSVVKDMPAIPAMPAVPAMSEIPAMSVSPTAAELAVEGVAKRRKMAGDFSDKEVMFGGNSVVKDMLQYLQFLQCP